MDHPLPNPHPRLSSRCLGNPGLCLAWPGPVLRLSTGKLGFVDVRPSWEAAGRKVAEGDWVQGLE